MLKKATWPLFTLSKKRKRIDTNPDYQRPAVWTKAQKQLLIDSILRDFLTATTLFSQATARTFHRVSVSS